MPKMPWPQGPCRMPHAHSCVPRSRVDSAARRHQTDASRPSSMQSRCVVKARRAEVPLQIRGSGRATWSLMPLHIRPRILGEYPSCHIPTGCAVQAASLWLILCEVCVPRRLCVLECTCLPHKTFLAHEAAQREVGRVGELASLISLGDKDARLGHRRIHRGRVEGANIELFGRTIKECLHDQVVMHSVVQEHDARRMAGSLAEDIDTLGLNVKGGNLHAKVCGQNSKLRGRDAWGTGHSEGLQCEWGMGRDG
mmetsp:Transcript_24102/g.61598  ORF Transcript_24102/g.61598 Transcript_24102/m.61598 type:complete len:253 (+) Transcript_24102:253-1011(+)